MLCRQSFAKLNFCARGIPFFQQKLAKQEPGFTKIWILLQCALQLNQRRLAVALLQVLLGRLKLLFRRLTATGREPNRNDECTEQRFSVA